MASSSSASSSASHASSDSDSPDRMTSRRHKKHKMSSSKLRKNITQAAQFDYYRTNIAEIFQNHYGTLSTAFSSCLVTVSNLLFSKQIISRDVHVKNLDSTEFDVKRAGKLVLCVQDWLYIHAEKWPELLKVLSEEVSLKSIMEEIESKTIISVTNIVQAYTTKIQVVYSDIQLRRKIAPKCAITHNAVVSLLRGEHNQLCAWLNGYNLTSLIIQELHFCS